MVLQFNFAVLLSALRFYLINFPENINILFLQNLLAMDMSSEEG